MNLLKKYFSREKAFQEIKRHRSVQQYFRSSLQIIINMLVQLIFESFEGVSCLGSFMEKGLLQCMTLKGLAGSIPLNLQ